MNTKTPCVCFYNPHSVTGTTGISLWSLFLRKAFPLKYQFIVQLIKNEPKSTIIVVDGTQSSLPLYLIFHGPLLELSIRVVSCIEIYIWCFLNTINPFKTKILFNHSELDTNSDVLIAFSGPFLDANLFEKTALYKYKGKKLFHFNHYFIGTAYIAQCLKKCNITHGIAEANLKKSPYFKKWFPFIESIYVLPFGLKNRFQKLTPLSSRKKKTILFGTSHKISYDKTNKNFMDFYKNPASYHHMRHVLYTEIHTLKNEKIMQYIDTPISHSPTNNASYFAFDIIQKYNEYQMFIAPEETAGLPSVNAIEGMACATAYIGLNHQMYKDIGLIPNKDYIAYDGTLDDLIERIEYYKHNQNQLKSIAQNGYSKVRKLFTQERVLSTFKRDIKRYVFTNKLVSSFISKHV